MMQDLLTELYRRGIRLRLSETGLEVIAPPGALTAELREELREQRDALITRLRASAGRPDPAEAVPLTGQPELAAEPFPLTDIQHAYLVGRSTSAELGGVATHYYFELDGDGLDPGRLELSLRRVIARHDMLRAVIGADDQQRILPDVPPYQLQVADLRGHAAAAQAEALQRARAELADQVRPAGVWPLFEFRLTRLAESRSVLHVSIDLLVADGYSLYLLFRDWQRFYAEPGSSPAALPFSYRDYVVASESLRDGRAYGQAEAYWADRLADLPPAPALPLARQPARISRPEFTRRRHEIAPAPWAAIKQAGRRRGLTPSTVLLAAFAEVLRLWAERPDFTLNLSLFHRPPLHPLIGEVIGDFTSVTLLGVPAPAQDRFADRAAGLQQQLLADLDHASYSGVRVIRDWAKRNGAAGLAATMPIVFTSVIGHAADGDEAAGLGLFGGRGFFGGFRYGISQTPQVALDHQVAEGDGALYINWDAVDALFPHGLLDDMFTAYTDLLARLARGQGWDDLAPAALPAWQAAERRAANATGALTRPRTLCELAQEQAARAPAAVAVIAGDGQLSYGEVAAQAHRLARHLAGLGTTRGDLVAVVLDKSKDMVPGLLGIMASGAAYLPIEPDWPEARRWQLLERSGARTVLTSAALRDRLTWPLGVDAVTLADPGVTGADPGPVDGGGPEPGDLAYVIFTSGSTGQPKGVMIEHASAASTVEDLNARFGVGPGDAILALSALSFDLSVYDIFGALAAGATVVMPAPGNQHDPVHWADLMARHRVTIWNSVPALMQAWLDNRPAGRGPDLDLRLVMLSGDWIPVSQPDAVRAVHPRARVVSLGGATEAAIWSVWYPVGEVPPEWASIPYGQPLARQRLHIYDAGLRPRPVWTTGEIFIGGAGVARGYLHDDERTAERFILHPDTGERMYRTGDLGRYLPGGDIEFLGRADSQVKINGYRIELGEITAALTRLPQVRDALVDVDVNPVTGRRQLAAYVVTADSADAVGPGDETGSEDSRWTTAVAAAAGLRQEGATARARELSEYHGLITAFNQTCPSLIARTFAELGWFTRAGEQASAADIVERCGIKLRYRWLVDQWLAMLARSGLLSVAGTSPGSYRCDRPLRVAELNEQTMAHLDAIRDAPADGPRRVLADYFTRCASHQPELLRGESNVLEFLLPEGSSDVTDAMYASNPLAQVQNRSVSGAVGAYLGQTAASEISILEVGAGTGATSAQVLADLPAGRYRYRFTDVSLFFTERARTAFAAYDGIEYSPYDVDKDPAAQGLAPGSADVIIAANVLHNARNLDWTLRQLRPLLTPGGMLVLIENTLNEPFHLVTVGYYQDLGTYEDERVLPLLTPERWIDRLRAAGFSQAEAVPRDGAAAIGQHILLARAATGPGRADLGGLRAQLEALLPSYMVPQRYQQIDRIPLTANGKVDRSALPAPAAAASQAELVPPSTGEQSVLLGIWREVLMREDFGVADNFFELGGDSLHALAIIRRLREELGVQVSAEEGLQLLFDAPTIAELGARLGPELGS